MNAKFSDKVFRIFFILAFVLGTLWMPGRSAKAQDPLPFFTVYYAMNSIHGGNWPLGTAVTLAIDDPTTPQNPDLTETKTVTMHPDGYTLVAFDSLPIDIKPGFHVSMTGDGITKDTTVIDIGQVSYDVDTDIISGVSTPNTELQIGADWNSWRNVVTGADGSWSADFSVLGDVIGHDQIVDIVPGTRLFVQKSDEDGDQSNYDWKVLYPSLYVFLPQFHQNPYDGLTSDPQGYEWPVDLPVTMTIDRPDTPQSPDFTIPGSSGEPDPAGGMHYWFNTNGILLYPGDIITATNGETTITQVMSELAVMGMDLNTDQISGTAEPWKTVNVYLNEFGIPRHVVTGPDGNWMADFSVPGDEPDEQDVGELVPGSSFSVNDGSANFYNIQITVPFITAYPAENIVKGEDFLQGEEVTLTIDDPDNGIGTDLTLQGMVDQTGGRCTRWCVEFDLPDWFHLAGGQVVTLSANTGTISYTVSNLTVGSIDILTDTVSGTAEPLSPVYLTMWFRDVTRHVTADEYGHWSADFSVPGTGTDEQGTCDFSNPDQNCDGMIIQWEGDDPLQDNRTRIDWRVPHPRITARPPDDAVFGGDWSLGVTVYLTIDDPDTGPGVDYSDSQPVTLEDWGGTRLNFNLDGFDVHTGQIITFTDGITTKELIVSRLDITTIDTQFDRVTGIAEPFGRMMVQVHSIGFDSSSVLEVRADQNGDWVAEFAGIWDITTDHEVHAGELDADGDETMDIQGFYAPPLPTIATRPGEQQISGYDWPEGAIINLMVDDPSTPQSPDYTDGLTADMQDWGQTEASFDLRGKFYFGSGYIITMTDGTTTKVHTVTNLDVTGVDPDNDLVYGIADPGDILNIFVWIPWSDSYAWRDIVADSNGEWVADFSIPVDGMTYDITDGTFGEVLERDEDEDFTNIYWYWPMAAKPCAAGDTVSGTVFEHDGITPVPFARIQFETFDNGEPLFFTYTDSNGQYACYLPNGDYRILAWVENYAYTQEYYNEAADVNATPLHITTGTQLESINFTISPTPAIEHFTFNLDNPLLQDRAVREAIALGTDRQRILNEAFLPNGTYGMISNSIVPPEHWASAPTSELDLYPFDPVQARIILEAAGWIDRDGDGYRENVSGVELSFVFKTSPTPFRQASAEIFRQNMQDIGIRITPEFAPLGEFLGSHDFDIAEFAWASSTDNEPYLGEYITGSQYNHAGYSNPAFDAALYNARAAVGDNAKLPYLYDAQGILSHDLPIFPLFTRYSVMPVSTPAGTNITLSPENYLDIHFAEVTQEGVTTVISTSIHPADLPPNFQLLGQVYDIGSSAQFTSAQACFVYDDAGLSQSQEDSIRLFHLEDNAWVDVTDDGYPDTGNNRVCGTVTSFSPFAIMYKPNQPPVADAGLGQIIFFGNTVTLNASASSDPDGDSLTYEWDLNNDGQYDDATGVTIVTSFNQVGAHTIGLRVTDDGGLSDTDTTTVTVLPWMLKGFFQPVDMNGIFNIVKGGSTVPLKFEVFVGSTELTDVSYIKSLTYAQTTCDATAITDEIETIAAGNTSLRYDPIAGQFIYNWKTPSTPGKCYRVILVTFDGSSIVAYFKLK